MPKTKEKSTAVKSKHPVKEEKKTTPQVKEQIDTNEESKQEENKSPLISKTIGGKELSDFAKYGSQMLRKTFDAGRIIMKDVTDDLPKDAKQYFSEKKEEVIKSIPKDVLHSLVSSAVDRAFAKIREHKLEVTIRIKKVDETHKTDNKAPEREEPKKNNPLVKKGYQPK